MKYKVFLCGIAACLSFSASANDHLEKLHKDTLIMQNIMTTSLKQGSRRGGIRFRKIETGYLAGQGLVFDVHTSNSAGDMHFNFNFNDIMQEVEDFTQAFDMHDPHGDSDIVVVPDIPDGFSFSFDMNEEAEEMAEEARERSRDTQRQNRERWRDLREKEKELDWEHREHNRNIRDYEFELRHSDDERKVKIEKEVKEIKKELEKIESRKAEYEKLAVELEEEEKSRKGKEQEAKLRQVKSFLANFESTIAETLCDYGSGLKSLPDNEKVNFILKDFAKGKNQRSREEMDKVYVFNLKDVRDCVLEKITPNDLLLKTETYMF